MDNHFPTNDYASENMHRQLPRLNSDMRFVGIFYIIYGAFTCLTIIGAVIGVPCIIMGIRLRDAARGLDEYNRSNSQQALAFAFEKQRSFFFIQKVIIFVMLAFLALYIFIVYMMFSSGMFDRFQDMGDFETLLFSATQLV